MLSSVTIIFLTTSFYYRFHFKFTSFVYIYTQKFQSTSQEENSPQKIVVEFLSTQKEPKVLAFGLTPHM